MSDNPQFDSLRELANERDRLYTERYTTQQKLIDTALAGQRDALDKAFASAQAALANEHSLIMEMLASLKAATADNRVEIEYLRNGASRMTGRDEPISAVVKWGAALLAGLLLVLVGHFWK